MIFTVIKEKLYNPEIGFYTAYGIEAVDESTQNIMASVSDVFLHEDKAQDFARLLTECGAEAVHLEELCMNAIE